jgi:aspartate/methionine/tyrosine aminotransferase
LKNDTTFEDVCKFCAPQLLFARRTDPFQESVIREMTRLGEETGSVNLSQGLPDFESPPEVLAAAMEAIRLGENQYTFPFGLQLFVKPLPKSIRRITI